MDIIALENSYLVKKIKILSISQREKFESYQNLNIFNKTKDLIKETHRIFSI